MNFNTFIAFRSRNYRLFFSGQSVSLTGTWMQRTAIYWLIYTQTHSSFMVGLAMFASQFPSFLFSPLGGVITDRYNPSRVMLFTQIAAMVQAALLGVLVIYTDYTVWEIFALSIIQGVAYAFEVPARQSMLHEIVAKKEDLPNAIALNSSMVNLAWLVGPAISGIVFEKLGAGVCFLMNALSFVAVITCLLFMKLPKYIPRVHSEKVIKEFREGYVYLKKTPTIGYLILLIGCISLFVFPFSTLLPVYAKVIFTGNASTFGYLNSFIGLGAVMGTIFLASLKPSAKLKKVLFINLLIFGGGLILFSHETNLPLALFFAMMAGFGMMSQTTITNTVIHTNVSREMRGRVIGYYAMAVFGMQPLGGLLIGAVSQSIGAPNTILISGISALVIALVFMPYLRKEVSKDKDETELWEFED
jgi:MFS family permease